MQAVVSHEFRIPEFGWRTGRSFQTEEPDLHNFCKHSQGSDRIWEDLPLVKGFELIATQRHPVTPARSPLRVPRQGLSEDPSSLSNPTLPERARLDLAGLEVIIAKHHRLLGYRHFSYQTRVTSDADSDITVAKPPTTGRITRPVASPSPLTPSTSANLFEGSGFAETSGTAR